MDIKINNDHENFKFRVCGILKFQNKYLVVKIADNPFYCLPGGHMEIGEDTETAVLREMSEELGFKVKINKLACIAQNFYNTQKNNSMCHEFSYYYIVEAVNESDINTNNYELIENDKGVLKKLQFVWLEKSEFDNLDFRPHFVKDMLESNTILHVVNKFDNARIDKFNI